MLTQNRAMTGFLKSRALTAAIVASVVLANSVAWGIPLLVGNGPLKSRPAYTDLRTGSLPGVREEGHTSNTVLSSNKPNFPLPAKAPPRAEQQGIERVALVSGGDARPNLARRPITMYPRPEPTPDLDKEARSRTTARSETAPPPAQPDLRKTTREVVLVSPYTPGVRIAPGRHDGKWRHRQLRAKVEATSTLDKARAIARRAARRFDQMRDRIARADRHAVEPDRSHLRSALLPVAPRPPRIVEAPGTKSASKSAHNYIRARLVRRPLGIAPASAPRTRQFALAPASIEAEAATAAPTEARPVSRPDRLTRTSPAARKTRRKRASTRSRRRVARVRGRQRTTVRRRNARRRPVTSHRRAPRKVNGFRRGFHRQLVAANFFGSSR